MTDEAMAERRRLFLEEMARIRERERQAQEDARATPPSTAPSALTGGVPTRRPTDAPRHRAALLSLMALCVALSFAIFGGIRREAQGMFQRRGQAPAWFGGGRAAPDGDPGRIAGLQRARVIFGLPDIIAVQRGEYGPFLLLRPGLSNEAIIAHARRVRNMLAGRAFPPNIPQPWRIGVCSADIPCPIAVVHAPGPSSGGAWQVTDGGRIIE